MFDRNFKIRNYNDTENSLEPDQFEVRIWQDPFADVAMTKKAYDQWDKAKKEDEHQEKKQMLENYL